MCLDREFDRVSERIVLTFSCVRIQHLLQFASSNHCEQTFQLNVILAKCCVHIYCSVSVDKSPLLRSFGNISDLISRYTGTHVSGSQQQRLE